MAIEDRNRIGVGTSHTEFNDTTLADINARIVHMEDILERKVDQWNAPTLIQLLHKTEYKMQVGTFSYAYLGGDCMFGIPLSSVWPAKHAFFMAIPESHLVQPIGYTHFSSVHGIQPLKYGVVKCRGGVTENPKYFKWLSIGK